MSQTGTPGGRQLRTVEDWAHLRPDKTALVDVGRRLTYGELNSRADRLADALAGRDLPAEVAAVCLPTCVDWFVVTYALAKLGWRQVTLSWRLTPPELRAVLADSGASVLFQHDAEPADGFPEWAGADVLVVRAGGEGDDPAGGPSVAELVEQGRPVARRGGAVQTVIYTSGTSGQPKGIVKPATRDRPWSPKAVEYFRNRRELYTIAADNRVLLTLPLHHGAGQGQARLALAAGCTVYLMNRYDPRVVLETIEEHRVTQWTVVPTMLQRIRALPADVLARHDVSSIENLGLCGSSTPTPLKRWAMDFFGEGKLHESYGATEIGTVAWMGPSEHEAKPDSCGRPLKGVDIRVVDAAGGAVGPGVEGELQIRTPVIADAYISGRGIEPELLTPDGYFRVGDVGKVDADGYLYINGRTKDMIISGGVNIFPAEIERVLLSHPAVDEAAVVGRPDEDLGEVAVGYCVPHPGCARPTPAELLSLAAKSLATFKLPREIHLVPALPRNDMGKVLKDQLRPWARAEVGSDEPAVR